MPLSESEFNLILNAMFKSKHSSQTPVRGRLRSYVVWNDAALRRGGQLPWFSFGILRRWICKYWRYQRSCSCLIAKYGNVLKRLKTYFRNGLQGERPLQSWPRTHKLISWHPTPLNHLLQRRIDQLIFDVICKQSTGQGEPMLSRFT